MLKLYLEKSYSFDIINNYGEFDDIYIGEISGLGQRVICNEFQITVPWVAA